MLGNRYQVGKEVGAGGMGTVYLGVDSQSQQTVAIKRLKSDLVQPELMERFKREGEALRELNHPNIVKLLDAIEHDGVHYLVMEYVSGGDLSDLLKNGRLPVERCLKLALDLADALTRAHKLDIVHRDLKPANVLIAEDGTLRLTDFGVAHIGQKQRVTDTDAIVGTVDYLAPESFDGGEVDPRADIWAFGVMLFEMLTGERPFQGDSIAQTLMAILIQPTPDLENLRPDAPIALVDLVYRMLEKDRNARLRSVRQVGLELEDILHGRTQQTPPETRFAPDTPALLHRPKHNLPAQTTPFVGREAELLEVAKLIENPQIRLVTILAPGGMGKTRLALEAAERQLAHFENGVYFVELAPLSDLAHIVTAIAESVSYQFQSDGREPKQQILDFLSNKNLLLILDNFEHLLDGASLVTAILNAASDVQILATSRQRLSQTGESLFHLAGMDFPKWETPKDALEYAAVKLFMNGALRAKPTFELTTDNLDYVARICRLVQGMPLGIVLAAAWLAMLSPHEIADEIQQGIDFLMNEAGEVPARQQSIRAVFDYSWQQMTDDEQQVFMKLSVFRGGFTREAAQEVAGANLRTLMNLTNKSLIRRDTDTGRYEIHELLRQYAEEKLSDLPPVQEDTLHKYGQYFMNLIAGDENEMVTGWKFSPQIAAIVASESKNLLQAWQYAIDEQWLSQIQKSLISLSFYFNRRDIVHLLRQIVGLLRTEPQPYKQRIALGFALVSYAEPLRVQGDYQNALKHFQEAIDILRSTNAAWTLAFALASFSLTLFNIGNFEQAQEVAQEAFRLSEQIEAIGYMAWALSTLAIIERMSGYYHKTRNLMQQSLELYKQNNSMGEYYLRRAYEAEIMQLQGEYKQAQQVLDEMLPLAIEAGNVLYIAQLYEFAGHIEHGLGNYALAKEHLLKSLDYAKAVNDPRRIAFTLVALGDVMAGSGDYQQAEMYYNEAIKVAKSAFQTWQEAWALFGLAQVAFAHKNYQQAQDYLQESLELCNQLRWLSGTAQIYQLRGRIAVALSEIDEAKNHFYKVLSTHLVTEAPPVILATLVGVAELFVHQAQPERAIELFALVLNHSATHADIKHTCQDLIDKLEGQIPADKFETVYKIGKSLDLQTAVKQLLDEFATSEK